MPAGADGRIADDSAHYNAIAKKVMQENDIAINDLHSFASEHAKEIQRPANVHFTPEGSKVLGKQVAKAIESALNKSK